MGHVIKAISCRVPVEEPGVYRFISKIIMLVTYCLPVQKWNLQVNEHFVKLNW